MMIIIFEWHTELMRVTLADFLEVSQNSFAVHMEFASL
jgi:hypothetical protein